jgi:plasmid stabilization system protein ParE
MRTDAERKIKRIEIIRVLHSSRHLAAELDDET